MITADEIREKADRQFRHYLKEYCLYAMNFFPLRIPANTGSALTGDLKTRKQELESLWKQSKNKKGTGYTLRTEVALTRKYGEQTVITGIFIDSEEDYLALTKRKAESDTFRKSVQILRSDAQGSESCINNWIISNLALLYKMPVDRYAPVPPTPDSYWHDIYLCADWLCCHPHSGLYQREVPVPVHTKFIEGNMTILRSLVAFLSGIPLEQVPPTLGLKMPGTLIRFRCTDITDKMYAGIVPGPERIAPESGNSAVSFRSGSELCDVSELAVSAEDFHRFSFTELDRIVVVENKLVYLTFPALPKTLCIFGEGFAVTRLDGCTFPETVRLLYFGDLDEHGFAILSDFRSIFPSAESFCMDMKTLRTFEKYRVAGSRLERNTLPENLMEQEQIVFDELRKDPEHNRLEQERITQAYIQECISAL